MPTIKNPCTEIMLTQLGAEWRYTNKASADQLRRGWDVGNAGRSRDRLEDAILNYAERMEGGSPAPAPIYRDQPGGDEVLDGVQRTGALILRSETEWGAYIVKTDSDRLARVIRVMSNYLLAGHAETPEWHKNQAIEILCIAEGMTVEEVARLGGWRVDDIRKLKQRRETAFRITSIGGPPTGKRGLPFGLVDAIGKVCRADDFTKAPKPISEFCHDLKRAQFLNGQWQSFVDDFFKVNRKKGSLHDQFTRNLENFRANPEVATRLSGRGPVPQKRDIKLIAALKRALTVVTRVENSAEVIYNMDEAFNLERQIRQSLERIHNHSRKAARGRKRSRSLSPKGGS